MFYSAVVFSFMYDKCNGRKPKFYFKFKGVFVPSLFFAISLHKMYRSFNSELVSFVTCNTAQPEIS